MEETHHSIANCKNKYSHYDSNESLILSFLYPLPSDSIWSNIPPVVRAGVSTELQLPQVAAVCHSSAEPLHVCAVSRFLLQGVHQEEAFETDCRVKTKSRKRRRQRVQRSTPSPQKDDG